MMRAAKTTFGLLGLLLLGLFAFVGVTLSAFTVLANTEAGRALIAKGAVRTLNDTLAGHFEMEGVTVLTGGTVELRGVRVYDPENELVLAVERARVGLDLTGLLHRVVTAQAEIVGPRVFLLETENGEFSLIRAFQPRAAQRSEKPSNGPVSFTYEIGHLAIRSGTVRWRSADGKTRLLAQNLSSDARAKLGPHSAEVELRLGADLESPLTAAGKVELRAQRTGDLVRLEVLNASLGASGLALTGEADLSSQKGRFAVTKLVVDRAEARALDRVLGRGADLDARAYLESDGKIANAAVSVAPAAGKGEAHVALAVRLDGSRALGLDLALDRLDPSRLLAALPQGEVTLFGHGAVSGSTPEDLAGHLDARLARSNLRGVSFGPGEVHARARSGDYEVTRCALEAPFGSLDLSGEWRHGGDVFGRASIGIDSLTLLSRAVARITGRPPLPAAGELRVAGTLTGTTKAPRVRATVVSRSLEGSDVLVRGLRGSFTGEGPLSAPQGTLELKTDRVQRDGEDLLRAVSLRAGIRAGEASVDFSAKARPFGEAPLTGRVRGRLNERAHTFILADLVLAWQRERWVLSTPATIDLLGPSVGRAELSCGDQRLVLEGGLSPSRTLDARLTVGKLDVSKLPNGLFPQGLGGEVTLFARATGKAARPDVTARFSLANGRVEGLEGLSASGDLSVDERAERMGVDVVAARIGGGRIQVKGYVAIPGLPGAKAQEDLVVSAQGLPVAELLRFSGSALPLSGKLDVDAALTGPLNAPGFKGTISLVDGAYREFGPLEGTVEVLAPATRIEVKAALSLAGKRALDLEGEAPFDLGRAMAHPTSALSTLKGTSMRGRLAIEGFDLASVAGKGGLPEDLAGALMAEVQIEGTPSAPRGSAQIRVEQLAVSGYRDIDARVEASLGKKGATALVKSTLAGATLLEGTASIDSAPEALFRHGALLRTPFRVAVQVPGVDLSRSTSAEVALAGTVSANVAASGTLGDPVVRADMQGEQISLRGRLLGGLSAECQYSNGRVKTTVDLVPSSGGKLLVEATVETPLGMNAKSDLAHAPVEVSVVADAVDLGFLPAVAPGLVRFASGTLSGALTARGPLENPRPRGHLRIEGAKVGAADYGDFTDVYMDLEVSEDAVHLKSLKARRNKGTLLVTAEAEGIALGAPKLEARVTFDQMTVARDGSELAKLDLKLEMNGTLRRDGLDLTVKTLDRGTITLPKKVPRQLQSLEPHPNIIVGESKASAGKASPTPSVEKANPFRAKIHLVVPGQLLVKSDDPRVDIELKADATYEIAGRHDYVTGDVEILRGFAEPLGGRRFEVSRGKLQFTGGPPSAATLDIEAKWTSSQSIEVTVNVVGSISDPQIKLSSKPVLDESQIAILVATGRSPSTSATNSPATSPTSSAPTSTSTSSTDVGYAAAGVLVTQAFKNVLADKLPVESISLDTKAVRAGTYIGRIYVAYVYRFDAKIEEGENQNEFTAEYSVGHGWTFESRYGDAGSGSASLLWSRNY